MKKHPFPQDLFRRTDTDPTYRTLFCAVCVNIIDLQHLSQHSADAFLGLQSLISSNTQLTSHQFNQLKGIKLEHDMRKRSDVIARGGLKPQFNAFESKLNTVYNKIGR